MKQLHVILQPLLLIWEDWFFGPAEALYILLVQVCEGLAIVEWVCGQEPAEVDIGTTLCSVILVQANCPAELPLSRGSPVFLPKNKI